LVVVGETVVYVVVVFVALVVVDELLVFVVVVMLVVVFVVWFGVVVVVLQKHIGEVVVGGVVDVVVVVVVGGRHDNPHGCFNIDATVSLHVPSKLTRSILSVHESAQYSFFPNRSIHMPVGDMTPAFVLSNNTSVVLVTRSCRLILRLPESVQ
jgi:hypothetical protein